MTAELLRLVVGELLLPFAGWIAAIGFICLLVGVVLHRWSRAKLAAEPRTTGRSLAHVVVVFVALVVVPLSATALSVPFVLQRTTAEMLETRAPPLIAWAAERGEALWLERSGFRRDAPLPPLSELRSGLGGGEGTTRTGFPSELALAAGPIVRIGEMASERLDVVIADALETVEASGARTWGEALAAVRPSVEARLTEEARAMAAVFRRGAWLELLPATAVALTGWILLVVLVLALPTVTAVSSSEGAPRAPRVGSGPDSPGTPG